MPAVELRVHDRNSGAYLTSLPNASDRQCQDVDNDTGTGSVTLGLGDADLGHMVEGNIVRCFVDGVAAYSWVVGPMDQSTVTPEEEAGEERRISGRGTLGLWADAIVYPETRHTGIGQVWPPLSERRVVDVRRFDFAVVGYDDSAWPAAVVVPPPPPLVPLDGTPSGWPLESQDWIWSRPQAAAAHPIGHSYFRHAFSVGGDTNSAIYITADNGFEVFLDGELLLSELRTPVLWSTSRSVQVELLAGTHFLAIKAANHEHAQGPSPAGVAVVVVALDGNGDPASVITSTGAPGWKCADYPAEPPGETVGLIIYKLWQEAQSRGALAGLTLGFSTTHDSAGIAWPNAPDVALAVGDDYLQVLRKLSELYCDVAMDPGSLRLDAWVSRGTNRSGSVSLAIGANITSLTHKGGEQARTSAILGRFGDHWLERAGSGRRQEKFLEMGTATSPAQAQRMIDAALAERSLPIITTTAGWEPTAGTVPWVHFKVGDQVSVPNAAGAMVAGRVKSISLSETQDDYDFVVEVGSVESDILDRLQRMARKAGHGALGGDFANATASTGSEGATDPTGGFLTSATPDMSLNSLTDVASVWDSAPVAGDFLSWNPDLGMNGMWEPASVVQDVGTTVVPEQDFGLAADPGISPFPASEGHTHGTPSPRHPQEGYPYVDFGSGDILLGTTDGEHSPAFLGTEDVGIYMRSFLTSPTGAAGWGRAAIDLHGTDDGTAVVKLYNDYAGGLYGAGGTPSAPFSLQLEGDLTLWSIANTPPVAPAGQARIYYNSAAGKAQISESGSAYRNIGGEVAFGVTVVGEQSFGQASAVGDSTSVARANHSHGTPLPRHPQVGWPYVDFGGTPGLIALGRSSTEHGPALVGTELLTGASRMFVTSPIPVAGGGRATLSLVGKDNGNAIVHLYNDLAAGQYGAPGTPSSPFGVELEGDFTFFTIANTPPVAPAGQAKIYFNASVQKLQLSENQGAYRNIGGSDLQLGTTVVGEEGFGFVPIVGVTNTAARTDHSHGSPRPRHPQLGWPYVDFGGTQGLLALGRLSTESGPGMVGTEDVTGALRLFITSPLRTGTSGRSTASFVGKDDGNATLHLYNDLDVNGNYGAGDGSASKPFSLELEGDMTWRTIANTPPAAAAGQAKVYFNSAVQKLQVSENGGPYRNIGGDVGTGSAGTFLVTDAGGTARRWTGATELVVASGNVGIGRAPVAGEYRLDIGSSNFGIRVTSGDPAFSLTSTTATTGREYLFQSLGADGRFRVFDNSAQQERLTILSNGNVGVGIANPDHKFQVAAGNVKVDGYIWPTLLTVRTTRPSLDGALFGVENVMAPVSGAPYERLYVTSPKAAAGWGVGVMDLRGHNDGTATGVFFNDLDINGNYGAGDGSASKPFRLGLEGAFEFQSINDTPGVAPAASAGPPVVASAARLYYDKTLRKLMLSEDGGAYTSISGGLVGTGAAGTFLVTDAGGTARRWTGATELVVASGNVGIGRAPVAGEYRLDIGSSNFGIRVTSGDPAFALASSTASTGKEYFFQSVGANGRLRILDNTAGQERFTLLSNGNVGIGQANPGSKLDVAGSLNVTGSVLVTESVVFPNAGHVGNGFINVANDVDIHETTRSLVALELTSPYKVDGAGRAAFELQGYDDGAAVLNLYNDKSITATAGGYYSNNGTGGESPFKVKLRGSLQMFGIVDSPPATLAASAMLFFDGTTNKLQLSENNGPFRNIGEPAPGAAGSVLVTNSTGTATRWSEGSEIFVDDANNRVGIGTTVPQEQLSVRWPTAGLISTFFGPIGNNSIAVGNDKTANNALRIGYDDSTNYGYLEVYGASSRTMAILADGSIGIGTTTSDGKMSFGAYNGNATGLPTISLHSNGSNKYGFGVHAGPNGQLQSFTTGYFAWHAGGFQSIGGSGEIMQLKGDGVLYLKKDLYVGSSNDFLIGKPYEWIGTIYDTRRGFGVSQLTDTGARVFRPAGVVATYQNTWVIGPAWHDGAGQAVIEMIGYGVNDAGSPRGARVNVYNDQDTNNQYGVVGATKRAMTFNVTGSVQSNGVTLTSARELKRGVRDDDKDSLGIVRKLRKRRYQWKEGSQEEQTGFVADEVAQADVELVTYDDGKPDGWKMVEMMAHTVSGVQTLADRCDQLTKQNAELTARLDALAKIK